MHARTAHPAHRRPAPNRWARVCVWLLALGVALQGSVIAMTRVAEPAHVHAATVEAPERRGDPMLDGVRAVQNHHASARHHHADVERHTHDATDGDVLYVGDDPATADAAKTGSGKRAPADLDTPTLTLPVQPAPLAFVSGGPAPAGEYSSHIGDRLERPPR